jgi:predicted GIY-YIG superfamily endonuclease
MAFWVYILRCADGRYYSGHTNDLERRFAQRQHGSFCDFTSRRLPVQLIWSETFQTREEALAAEMRIKPWSRAKKEALVRGDWASLSLYAKPPRERPSTSLGTNGNGAQLQTPFVSSEVETRSSRA